MKLLIFTYAPTGLGHLRVTDALVEQRPKNSSYVLLGSLDRFVTWIHRFTSINPFGKLIFLAAQYGLFEDIFTFFYRRFLILTSKELCKGLVDVINRNQNADEVWVIATHFGMAHQIGAIKESLAKKTGKSIRLIVQVTDDTSQHIWCVSGADLTFVPSMHVKKEFEEYAKTHKIHFNGEVIPYPLASTLTKILPGGRSSRQKAFLEKTGQINIAIPISGAAVGLKYFQDLMTELIRYSDRYNFIVVVKTSPFTAMFIKEIRKIPRVDVMVGKNDVQMIELYELMYENNLIHIEITKPSEQSFKSILHPSNVGGSVLLFTSPVGRQEKDNIEFMQRHKLIAGNEYDYIPRGVRIPANPVEAAKQIHHSVINGFYTKMTSPSFRFSRKSLLSGEVGLDGAKLFWKKSERILSSEFYETD